MTDPKPLSVTLTRTFDAPIGLVYSAWADASHASRWMKCESDVVLHCDSWEPAVGATYATTMEKPGQWSVKGTARFTQVEPPRLLESTSDPNPGMGAPSMTVRVELESLGDDRTRLTLTHSGIPGDDMCGIIEGGWTNSLKMLGDQLAARA